MNNKVIHDIAIGCKNINLDFVLISIINGRVLIITAPKPDDILNYTFSNDVSNEKYDIISYMSLNAEKFISSIGDNIIYYNSMYESVTRQYLHDIVGLRRELNFVILTKFILNKLLNSTNESINNLIGISLKDIMKEDEKNE